jgi:hypothetical protein
MLGAVGAIALIAMVFWDAFPSSVEESPLQLADNVPRPGVARENLAEELSVSSAAVKIAKPAEADRDAVEGVVESVVEAAPEPGPEILAVAPPAGEPASAAAPEEVRDLAPPKRASVSAVSEASESPVSPGGAELAAPAVVAEPLADAAEAVEADEPEPVVAEKPSGNKPAAGMEVSRENVNGQLVAVRYEVAVSRSRLGELNTWRKKQSSQARPAAARAAPRPLSRSLRTPAAASKSARKMRLRAPAAEAEALTLLVDPGRLESLRAELGSLQGPAGASLPANSSAAKDGAAQPDRAREASAALAGKTGSTKRKSGGFGQLGNWPGSKKKASSAKARAPAPEKSRAVEAAKVRVEIRFRIVSD